LIKIHVNVGQLKYTSVNYSLPIAPATILFSVADYGLQVF